MLNTNNANIVTGLGDPLGGYIGIITVALVVAGIIVLVIGIASVISRK